MRFFALVNGKRDSTIHIDLPKKHKYGTIYMILKEHLFLKYPKQIIECETLGPAREFSLLCPILSAKTLIQSDHNPCVFFEAGCLNENNQLSFENMHPTLSDFAESDIEFNVYQTIEMLKRNKSDNFLQVKSLTGKTYNLDFHSGETVHDLKVRFADALGEDVQRIPEYRFVFAGKRLQNSKKLHEYNIQKEATIHCILGLRGGMYHCSSGDIPKVDVTILSKRGEQQIEVNVGSTLLENFSKIQLILPNEL